jgi:uncharacterized protein DUF4365
MAGTMTDGLLTGTDREEALSRAYIQAIAAGAGYVVATMDFDRDGVDVEIKAGGAMRPSIALQLKATINLGDAVDGVFRFPLKRRNYDLLREQTQVPRLLVILDLPKEEKHWLSVTPEELVLRRCAFWASLAGLPDTDNRESVTVSIPSANLFDIVNLRILMEQSRTGAIA